MIEARKPLVQLRGLAKHYGAFAAVDAVDLSIYPQDFMAILGPSGSGKTTLLKMLGGFVEPTAGRIEIDGVDITRLGPDRRPTNMVFQSYGLFPHMTVRQNISYGLKLGRVSAEETRARVDEMLALLHIRELESRLIHALSGGQQQRVALARALVMKPKVLLLDEPLAALDLKMRQRMHEELRRIHHQIGGTFIFVTHDQGEALALSNRIAVMNRGRVEQEGDPETIYARPATKFVAGFIGDANIFEGRRDNGTVRFDGGSFPMAGDDAKVAIVVRPEAMAFSGAGADSCLALSARVAEAVYMGARARYRATTDSGQEIVIEQPIVGRRPPVNVGAPVSVTWRAEDQWVIPANG